ncbi:Endoglucanase precursor [Rothia dentocariosa]|uniref:Endoglucanase n=1 Tax=Rothia dentocariosa TaxID=2047 RepID=A0A448UYL4_9MICC|nr:Endoglucanase precursor [Rothia dentocariosa]
MVEKNDGLESNLWLNRLVNTAKTPEPEQPKPADPTTEPTPEPTQPTPEPSKPAETPTPEPSESSEAPAPEPSKPADPAPTPEPSKSADPAPTAPAPEPSKPNEPEPSKPAEPEPSKPAEPAQSFSDVHEGDMFYREITWLAGQNITTGWVDGTFRPHESIEREAIAAFFYRMSGSPEVQLPKDSPFTDVKEGDPFYKEIIWFQQQGITTGWPDKTFRPHDPVSREAMAAFFYRYSGKPPVEVQNAPFKDVPEQNMFYREIAWLHDSKITTGWDDGTFRPHESISREAMAAFLYRYAHRG